MKIDERHLVQLAAVINAGGVTEGAALLGMTQPAVSRTLATLEKRLGEPLFVKGRRPLRPTPFGRALADHGQAMLLASRKASELIDNFRHGLAGTVRVAGTPFFMDGLISGLIAEFHNARPDVRVIQSYGYMPDLQDAIRADRVDLAICPVDVLDGDDLEFQSILPGRNVVACRVTHPLLMKRKLRGPEILDYPWIAPPPNSPLQADMRALLLSFGSTGVNVPYVGGSLASAMNYLKRTDALTILPHGVVFAYRKEREITALPLRVPHPDRALGVLRLAGSPQSPAATAFSDSVAKGFAALAELIRRHEQSVIWKG
ncbi:putative transcriptional regulatory protein, LysR family [Bradyrhizobium sp. ORS 375]|uniref:LysR family transcriptional regulator n=1 Tax=Bradyrhizobium sp. (strain ORS 375) TaxID=566679 RepID=UPI00024095F1|nr:LysR family transcriptional regulator [Bradyrhizobium sp. ORS 375]CCD91025.1 putative transcriptional regulatory protein, LysR family [Bradyrhizobium sp. ORS 375]